MNIYNLLTYYNMSSVNYLHIYAQIMVNYTCILDRHANIKSKINVH